jgi:hypothetical protein
VAATHGTLGARHPNRLTVKFEVDLGPGHQTCSLPKLDRDRHLTF